MSSKVKRVIDNTGKNVFFQGLVQETFDMKTGESLSSILKKTTLVKLPVAIFPDFIANPNNITAIVGSTDQAAINEYCKSVLANVSSDSKFFIFASNSDGGSTSPVTFSNGDVAADITLELYGVSFTYFDLALKKHYLFSGSLQIIENEGVYSLTPSFTKEELKSDDVFRLINLTNTLSDESTSEEIVGCIGDFNALVAAVQATEVIITNDEDEVMHVDAKTSYSSDNDNYEVVLAVRVTEGNMFSVYTITGTNNSDLVCKVKEIPFSVKIVNDLNATTPGTALDAMQGSALKKLINQKVYYLEGVQTLSNSSTKNEIESVISSWTDLVAAVENGAIIKNMPTFEDEIQFIFTFRKEGDPQVTDIFLSDIADKQVFQYVFSSPDNGVTLSVKTDNFSLATSEEAGFVFDCNPFSLTKTSTSSQINIATGGYLNLKNAIDSGKMICQKGNTASDGSISARKSISASYVPSGGTATFSFVDLSMDMNGKITDLREVIASYNTSTLTWAMVKAVDTAIDPITEFKPLNEGGLPYIEVIHASGQGSKFPLHFSGLTLRGAGALIDETSSSDAIKEVFDNSIGWDEIYAASTGEFGLIIQADLWGAVETVCNSRGFEDGTGQILLLTGFTSDDGTAPYMAFDLQVKRDANGVYSILTLNTIPVVFADPKTGLVSLYSLPQAVREPFVQIKVAELELAVTEGFTAGNMIGATNPTQGQVNTYCNDFANRVSADSRQFIFVSLNSSASMLVLKGLSVHVDANLIELDGIYARWYDEDTNAEWIFVGKITMTKTGNNWELSPAIGKMVVQIIQGS